jgi:hypothetical protein
MIGVPGNCVLPSSFVASATVWRPRYVTTIATCGDKCYCIGTSESLTRQGGGCQVLVARNKLWYLQGISSASDVPTTLAPLTTRTGDASHWCTHQAMGGTPAVTVKQKTCASACVVQPRWLANESAQSGN